MYVELLDQHLGRFLLDRWPAFMMCVVRGLASSRASGKRISSVRVPPCGLAESERTIVTGSLEAVVRGWLAAVDDMADGILGLAAW